MNQLVNQQPFQRVVLIGGVLPFQQPPFFTVLVCHVCKQDCPCYDIIMFVCDIGGLGIHRIGIKLIPVPARHTGTEITLAFPIVIYLVKPVVHMQFQTGIMPIGIGVPLPGEDISGKPVQDSRGKQLSNLRFKDKRPHEFSGFHFEGPVPFNIDITD